MTANPVTLIVADAGPLISLAVADRLDLLQMFDKPVATLDVVREECLRKKDAPGEQRLRNWFNSNERKVEVVSTPFHAMYVQALANETSGIDPHATEGMGDAAISWFVVKAPRIYGKSTISLVLTEDGPFGDTRLGRNVHVLSTRPFLKTLEALGKIPSALDIIRDIERGGRSVSRYQVDRPALVGKTGKARTDWADAVSKKAGRGLG